MRKRRIHSTKLEMMELIQYHIATILKIDKQNEKIKRNINSILSAIEPLPDSRILIRMALIPCGKRNCFREIKKAAEIIDRLLTKRRKNDTTRNTKSGRRN